MTWRLDQEVAVRNLSRSRSHARQLIADGYITLNGKVITKPSYPCGEGDEIIVTGGHAYVSRGGVKLEKALQVFDIDVSGMAAADLGASTGGFTHCLLMAGAAKVYAIDVGRGQLADLLRRDERVVSLEQTDVRDVTQEQIGDGVRLIVCDLSFISLSKVLSHIVRLLLPGGQAICLLKPQFEAGRKYVGKSGLVINPRAHVMALEGLRDAASACGMYLTQCIPSPIRGGDGNVEYLALLERVSAPCPLFSEIVTQAFEGEKSHE